MLKKIVVASIASFLSLGSYALDVKDVNAEVIKETVENKLLPYQKEYVPFLLKEYNSLNCIETNCGGLNKLIMKEVENGYDVIVSGYALRNDFSYRDPLFQGKDGFLVKPITIKFKSLEKESAESVSNNGLRKVPQGLFETVYTLSKRDFKSLKGIVLTQDLYAKTVPSIIEASDSEISYRIDSRSTDISNKMEIVFIDNSVTKSKVLEPKDTIKNSETINVVRNLSINPTIIKGIKNPVYLNTIITINSPENKEVNLGKVTFDNSYLINVSTNNFLKKDGDNLIASLKIGENKIIFDEMLSSNDLSFEIKNNIYGVDKEIWIVENNPSWSAPIGVTPISSIDSRVPENLKGKNAYLVTDKITVPLKEINMKQKVSSNSLVKLSYLQDGKYKTWDKYLLDVNPNTLNNIVSIKDNLKDEVSINAALKNKKEIPVYQSNNIPYIKADESASYEIQYDSISPNSSVIDIEDGNMTYKLLTNPRERVLWVNGADFKGTELSNWSFYSIFWLVFFGFITWKLLNWKLSILMILSFVLLNPIFGHMISVFWVLMLASILYIAKKKGTEDDFKFVKIAIILALLIVLPNTLKFTNLEIKSMINPNVEMQLYGVPKVNFNTINLFSWMDRNVGSSNFGSSSVGSSNFGSSSSNMVEDLPVPVKEYSNLQNMGDVSLLRAPQKEESIMLAKSVEIIKEDNIYESQVMRSEPLFNNPLTYFNRTLNVNYDGKLVENISPVIAPRWMVNIAGCLQIVMILFLLAFNLVLFTHSFKRFNEVNNKESLLEVNIFKMKG